MVENSYSYSELEESDFEWFLNIRNQSRESLHNSTFFTIEQSAPWFKENRHTFRRINFQHIPIGYFRIGDIQEKYGKKLLLVGADLSPSFRGKGHAFNAYKYLLPLLQAEFNTDGFILSVLPSNQIAQNLYLKLGFSTSNLTFSVSSESREISISDIEMVLFSGSRSIDFIQLINKAVIL